jgi:two-component system probable response regulator PhcQ
VQSRRTSPSHLRSIHAMVRVLIVDDDVVLLRSFKRVVQLRRPTWDITTVPSVNDALGVLMVGNFDVIVTDYEMPEADGVQLLRVVQSRFPDVLRIILSGQPAPMVSDNPSDAVQAWLSKDCGINELIDAIERLLSQMQRLASRVEAC